MQKWINYSSYVLNIILVITVIIVFRDDEPVEEPFDSSKYTQQNLSISVDLTNEMDSSEVRKIMGKPIIKEILGREEEWHYCRTNEYVDEYIAIKFEDNKLTTLSHYTVSALDIVYTHTDTPNPALASFMRGGSCEKFIRWGTYGEAIPNNPLKGDRDKAAAL